MNHPSAPGPHPSGGYYPPPAGPGPAPYQPYGYAPPGPWPPPAGWGSRAAAILIDGLITGFGFYLIFLAFPLLGFAMGAAADASLDTMDAIGGLSAAFGFFTATAAVFCYYWLMHARDGQTLGKKALRIRVLSLRTGGPPSTGAAAGRYATTMALGLVPFGGLVNLLWPLWDEPYRQALHDKAAGTRVIAE